MYVFADLAEKDKKIKGVANNLSNKRNRHRLEFKNGHLQRFSSVDIRHAMDNNGHIQGMAHHMSKRVQSNNTGLPDPLKSGLELLSDMDMSEVRVHYNSDKPAQLQAHAYTLGTDIYIAPGKEKYLSHEAWHVVQQKQGRVQPTIQHKSGLQINNDDSLEREADEMGEEILRKGRSSNLPFGNLLSGQQSANSHTAQLAIENEEYSDDKENNRKASLFFDNIDEKVQAAYEFVLSVPSLDGIPDYDGNIELWKTKWQQFLDGEGPALLAATFGYVIETLVSNKASTFHVVAPSGTNIVAQEQAGGTRPDLVLKVGSESIAWADITASNSEGHIFDKNGWWRHIDIFAEVTYPSLNDASLGLMEHNRDNTSNISASQLKERLQVARKIYARRKEHWEKLGKAFTITKLGSEVPGNRMTQNLDPSIRQKFIQERLEKHFDIAEIDLELVPSILVAMGIGPETWHFNSSATEKAGESWLLTQEKDNAVSPGIENFLYWMVEHPYLAMGPKALYYLSAFSAGASNSAHSGLSFEDTLLQ